MAANYYQPFSLRVSESLLDKVKYIAKQNKRSATKELEFIIENYICEYEEAHGIINLSDEK